jgi:hypothetical protein
MDFSPARRSAASVRRQPPEYWSYMQANKMTENKFWSDIVNQLDPSIPTRKADAWSRHWPNITA